MGRSAFMVIVLMGFLAVSCSAGGRTADEELNLFIGALEDSDAKIALVRDDADWVAYVCGGASSLSSLTSWFQGDVAPAGRDEVLARSDAKVLHATFRDEAATGTLTIDGAGAIRFDASRVPQGAPAGLCQRFSDGCRTGLIVPPGRGEPQGVYCVDPGPSDPRLRLFEQVTPVAPIRLGDTIVAARVLDVRAQIIHLTKVALPLDSS